MIFIEKVVIKMVYIVTVNYAKESMILSTVKLIENLWQLKSRLML